MAETGLKQIFLTLRPALIRFLAGRGMSADEAQDMAQDLYLKLDEDRIGPVADPRAYLYRMADNLVLDRRRAALRRLNRETAWDAAGGRGGGDLDPQPSAETRLIDRERLAKGAEALAALPPRTREIFSRYRLAGEPQREIAVALGISLSAVEKHLHALIASSSTVGAASIPMRRQVSLGERKARSMQPDAKASAHDAAIAWLLRLRDGDSSDWEAFTLWLEADAAHAIAYDMVMLADADLGILTMASTSSMAANDDDPPVPRRLSRWAAAVAVAAAAVAGITLIRPMSSPMPARQVWTTAPGERREVALGDGSRVAMNGGTILVLDRTDVRRVELRTGEALFTVRHSLVRPFTVVTGTDSIVDTGTVFNIARDAGHLRVAVARGSVRFNPDAENIGLVAGGILTRMPNGRLLRAQGNPAAAGSWRAGRLEFDDWPLAAVAVDLARNTGLRISVDPAIARQKFSGTVLLDVDPARTVARVAGLAGVTARYERGVWRLAPGQRPAR